MRVERKVIETVRFIFPPPSRGRSGGDCNTNISSIFYKTIPLELPLTKGEKCTESKPSRGQEGIVSPHDFNCRGVPRVRPQCSPHVDVTGAHRGTPLHVDGISRNISSSRASPQPSPVGREQESHTLLVFPASPMGGGVEGAFGGGGFRGRGSTVQPPPPPHSSATP